MNRPSMLYPLGLLLLALLLPATCMAQGRLRAVPEPAARAIELWRNAPGERAGEARALAVLVLRQDFPGASREAADSMAHALVALSRTSPPALAQVNIVLALVYAARQEGEGVPYAESFDRLLEIYEQAEDVGMRGLALSRLGQVGPASRTLQVWRSIATRAERDPTFPTAATAALALLCEEGGPEGVRVLRELHESGTVVDRDGRVELQILAERGFPCPAGASNGAVLSNAEEAASASASR